MRSKTAYVLSRDPYIITGSFGVLEELPAGPPVTILYHLPWWLHPLGAWRLRRRIDSLRERRKAKVIVCTNERREMWVARALGLTAHWHNHNIHVREDLFRPIDQQPEQCYAAVYAAALDRYKRLELAAEVDPLYVLTYKRGEQGGWDLHREVPALKHAIYNPVFLDEAAVNALYAQAGCGLALSLYEGAMFSSMEYLMAGLPVVSTYSAGGRRVFRDPLYWREVAANPRAIASAVREWAVHPPERGAVRERVLEKLRAHRIRFAARVQNLTGRGGSATAEVERIWRGVGGLAKFQIPASSA